MQNEQNHKLDELNKKVGQILGYDTRHTKYHYQLKKEIERMILDRLLKKYVKYDTYQGL